MSDDEFIEIKLRIPKKHLFFGYTADASSLRYYQDGFNKLPNDEGKKHSEAIEKYLNTCKAKQSFFTIVSDNTIEPETIIQSPDFINEDEMEI